MKATRSKLEIILAFVLCFTMLFSMAVPVFAESNEGTEPEISTCEKCGLAVHEGSCACTKLENCPADEGVHQQGCPKAVQPEPECSHESHSTDGKCSACGEVVSHSYNAEHVCSICGVAEPMMTNPAPLAECTGLYNCPAEDGNHSAACHTQCTCTKMCTGNNEDCVVCGNNDAYKNCMYCICVAKCAEEIDSCNRCREDHSKCAGQCIKSDECPASTHISDCPKYISPGAPPEIWVDDTLRNFSLKEGEMVMDAGAMFLALDSVEEIKAKGYYDWNAEFYLTISGNEEPINLLGCGIGGYIIGFTQYAYDVDMNVPAGGISIPIIATLTGGSFSVTYGMVCEFSETYKDDPEKKYFKCGIILADEILEKESNLKATLDLVLTNTNDPYQAPLKLHEITYNASDLAGDSNKIAHIDRSTGAEWFETLAKANEAAEPGEIIVLADSVNEQIALKDGVSIDLNGCTLTGNMLGTLKVNGGKYIANDNYKLIAPAGTDGFVFASSDAVINVVSMNELEVVSGDITLAQNWQTLPGQSLTLGKDASFTIPDTMTYSVFGKAIVEGSLDVEGSISLGRNEAGFPVITDATLAVSSPLEDGKVVSAVEGFEVVYEDGVYKLMELADVAEVDGVGFKSVDEAIEAADSNDTVVLLRGVTLAEMIKVPEDKTITLDLNGNTIEVAHEPNSSERHIYAFENRGTMTITGVGTISARGILNYGTMNIEGGSFENIDSDGGAAVFNHGTLKITGGSFDGAYCAVNNRGTGDLTITGGSFNAAAEYTIRNFGSMTISNASVTGDYGAVYQDSEADGGRDAVSTISGGTFTVTKGCADYSTVSIANGKMTISNGTFTPASNTEEGTLTTCGSNARVSVSGGSFGADTKGSVAGIDNTISISGGKYKAAPDQKFIIENHKAAKGSDDMYEIVLDESKAVAKVGDTSYFDLSAALAEANANPGSTFTLLKQIADLQLNFTADVTFVIGSEVTELTGDFSISDSIMTISAKDLDKLSGGMKLEFGAAQVGNNVLGMEDGVLKSDSAGNLTATPSPKANGEKAMVGVNEHAIYFENSNAASAVSVSVTAGGDVTVPAGSEVEFANGAKVDVDNEAVISGGTLKLVPNEVETNGYGMVVITEGTGTAEKSTGILVPVNTKNNKCYEVSIKLNADGKLEVSSEAPEELISDEGADGKKYLTIGPEKKSFYKYGIATLKFEANGFLDCLDKVLVDGKEINSDNYTLKRGSTIITLKNSYLKNLSLGNHTLTLEYKDGESISATISVVSTPITGDSGIAPFACIMALSSIAMLALLIVLKKKSRA